ncbi:hypothetical protein [Rhizobium binxianense]
MQTLRNVILISAGMIAAAGFAGGAAAQSRVNQSQSTHVMSVRLPDGSLERIRYAGDRPPEVRFERQLAAPLAFMPVFDGFGPDSPFADLERISAAMDRQAAAMLDEAGDVTLSNPDGLIGIDFRNLPPGTQGYTVISTMSGNQACTRSLRYFNSGSGKPQVETSASGNCGAIQGHAQKPAHAAAPRPTAKPKPSNVIEASYHGDPAAGTTDAGSFKTAGLF